MRSLRSQAIFALLFAPSLCFYGAWIACGRRYVDGAEAAEPDLFLSPLPRRRLSIEPAVSPGAD